MRIAIVGNAGSGKSTLASRVASGVGSAHVELDGLFHLPGWAQRDHESFRSEADARLPIDGSWVADGNYVSHVDDLVRGRADTIVIFDLARWQVMRQLTRRTLHRVIRREVLWNGNRESLANLLRWDPARNIVRWAWVQHTAYSQRNSELASTSWSHADIIVVRSHADADRWLATLVAD